MKSDVQLNLRAKESQRALIDAAAEILHKSRTDFILEMACKAAENVILDRRVFNFNDEQYAEFIDMLDAPVEDDSAINELLARKPQWDVEPRPSRSPALISWLSSSVERQSSING